MTPRGARLSELNPSAMGTAPPIVATEVMRMGRNRSCAASNADSQREIPRSCSSWWAYSTMRIPFLATSPTSRIRPTWLKKESVIPTSHRPRKAPARASGTAMRIEIGSTKLSNWAASVRYTSARASANTAPRPAALSSKSRDSPASAVRKPAGNVWSATTRARSIASPSVMPSRFPLIVADGDRS